MSSKLAPAEQGDDSAENEKGKFRRSVVEAPVEEKKVSEFETERADRLRQKEFKER